MTDFVLNSISLLSLKEKRAKAVEFDPKVTVVKGANDTGKSSLLKNIYWTFGAEPAHIHPSWPAARVTTLVHFTLRGERMSMLRDGKIYALFDESARAMGVFTGVVGELGPFLAKLFGFQLRLPNRNGEIIVPPPAHMFLPYYVDQDRGWNTTYDCFKGLRLIKDYRKNALEYHSGLRPNEYYRIKGQIDDCRSRRQEALREEEVLAGIHGRLREELTQDTFDVSIDDFKAEVDQLLERCDELRVLEEASRGRLADLYSSRHIIKRQIGITAKAHQEIEKDYEFALSIAEDEIIECPTCGTEHSNTFAERFYLAQDANRCMELIAELEQDLLVAESDIQKEEAVIQSHKEKAAEINGILTAKKGAVELSDIVAKRGRKELDSVLVRDIGDVHKEIGRLDAELESLATQLSKYDSKEHKDAIQGSYRSLMDEYLAELDVTKLPPKSYSSISSQIKEQGSDLPRALLAAYYSVLGVTLRHGSCAFCPIVIDSPKQQDQDATNYPRMLEFLRDHQPENSQLILGLVDDCEVTFEGSVVELETKYSLLQEDGFTEIRDEVLAYRNAARNADP